MRPLSLQTLSGLLTALALAIAASIMPQASRAAEITVFGAASLTNALTQAGNAWAQKTGNTVRYSFASSSTLARQIEAGAPADLYLSANEKWMAYLAAKGLIEADTRSSPIGNSLVVVAPATSQIAIHEPAHDIPRIIGKDNRLAVGDPAHVPAGIYARQSLESLGIWQVLEPRLARADNVRAALALVERGEVPLGIVYETDAKIAGNVKIVARLPATSHKPITYPFAILKGRKSAATESLLAYLTGAEGLAIFEGYGFTRTDGN